jgi:Retrotransposon gag protein
MPPKRAPATGSAAGSQRPDPDVDSDHNDDDITPPAPDTIIEELRAQLEAANARLASAPVQARRDPKIPSPPEFSGKVSEFRNFMAQCTLTFHMCPNTYVTDEQKVLFIISLLRGPALTWARDIPEQSDHHLRNDYTEFKKALSNLYLDRNLKAACEDKLSHLRQTKSAAAYAVEFQSTVAPLGLNNDAECLFFYLGLKPDIKDDLATVGRATTLNALIDQAVGIDQRKHQRRLEEKKSNPSTSSPSSSSASISRDFKPKPQSNSASANLVSSSGTSKPHGPLTEAEKSRRKQKGLCMYCADPAHVWANCPRRLAHAAKANALPVVPSYSQHLSSVPTGFTIQSGNGNPQAPTRSEA